MRGPALHSAKTPSTALPRIFKLLIVFAVVNTFLVAGIESQQFVVFRNTAIVKSVDIGVYWDSACERPVNIINWGVIEAGQKKTMVVYVRNEGTWDLDLSIWAANWSPAEAETFMNFSSSYQGQPIEVGDTVSISLVLSASSEIRDVASFGFDMIFETSG